MTTDVITLIVDPQPVLVLERPMGERVVEVLVPGPMGPKGEPGAGMAFTHSSAAETWTINHNLGYQPSITIFTVGGVEVEANIVHVSANQALIQFNTPTAGSARLV